MGSRDMSDATGQGAVGPALWVGLPTECPTCGAAVDQARACRSPDPRCPFCRGPLPCTPITASPSSTVLGVDTPAQPPAPPGRPSGTSSTFGADLYLLAKAEGGRHTPIFTGYRPQITLADGPVSATLTLESPAVMAIPGEHASCSFELPGPVALNAGQTFDVLEGDRLIGRATVRDVR